MTLESRIGALTGTLAILLALPPLSSVSAATTLVNLVGRENGPGEPVALWCETGAYNVTVASIAGGGAYDAWNAWGFTSCMSSTGCARTGPTIHTGRLLAYSVFSPDISQVSIAGVPLASSICLAGSRRKHVSAVLCH